MKKEKAKQELIRLIKPHSQGGFICSCCISPLEFFGLFFSFKTIANSNRQIQRACADAAYEFVRLISLINSYLAFSLFHFSKTTLLQLGINAFFNEEIFSDNLNNVKREYSHTQVNIVRLYIAKNIKLGQHFLVAIDQN